MQQEIRLKNLPFLEVVQTLIPPTALTVEMVEGFTVNNFQLHLGAQQATDIALHRDNQLNRYLYQVQLRFCLPQTCSEQDDNYPNSLAVAVNNQPIPLPPLITPKLASDPPKRPFKPLDITSKLKLSPMVTNSIKIIHSAITFQGHIVSAYLVKVLTWANLLEKVRMKETQPVDVTRAFIKEKMSVDTDVDVKTTTLEVSLVCPLSKKRITVPCRLSTCSHAQCFDAETYLKMNEKKESWTCPFCNKAGKFEDLIIDGYFQELLSSTEQNEVTFNPDGTWTTC